MTKIANAPAISFPAPADLGGGPAPAATQALAPIAGDNIADLLLLAWARMGDTLGKKAVKKAKAMDAKVKAGETPTEEEKLELQRATEFYTDAIKRVSDTSANFDKIADYILGNTKQN